MNTDEATDGLTRVMTIVRETGQIALSNPDEDFYDAGFTSLKSLELLIELESEWNIGIPDEEFIAARSARSLFALVSRLTDGVPCA